MGLWQLPKKKNIPTLSKQKCQWGILQSYAVVTYFLKEVQ
jgi:hypothetical protein